MALCHKRNWYPRRLPCQAATAPVTHGAHRSKQLTSQKKPKKEDNDDDGQPTLHAEPRQAAPPNPRLRPWPRDAATTTTAATRDRTTRTGPVARRQPAPPVWTSCLTWWGPVEASVAAQTLTRIDAHARPLSRAVSRCLALPGLGRCSGGMDDSICRCLSGHARQQTRKKQPRGEELLLALGAGVDSTGPGFFSQARLSRALPAWLLAAGGAGGAAIAGSAAIAADDGAPALSRMLPAHPFLRRHHDANGLRIRREDGLSQAHRWRAAGCSLAARCEGRRCSALVALPCHAMPCYAMLCHAMLWRARCGAAMLATGTTRPPLALIRRAGGCPSGRQVTLPYCSIQYARLFCFLLRP